MEHLDKVESGLLLVCEALQYSCHTMHAGHTATCCFELLVTSKWCKHLLELDKILEQQYPVAYLLVRVDSVIDRIGRS